ncbi:MAG: domain S-box protein [Mucilaginibacter sp.]|nr:domain S-box protein [Mucilaginibacter sp.]
MSHSLKILHIEDIKSDAELVERTLEKSGIAFEKRIVDTKADFTKALAEFDPDIILSDHSLPSFNSLEALDILKQSGKNIPFILITATVSEEFAVNVMQEGASDYILKDRLQRLPSAIVKAVEKHQSDIERQAYLNKIFASETLFTKAELLAEFGTWRIDLVTDTTNWSAGTYELLGYKQGEIEPSYENFIRNIHPDDVKEIENNFKNAVDNTQPAEADFRIINKDGTTRYLHAQFEFELNEKNERVHIIGFTQDITRSKLAQREIQENIEELKAASDRQSDILNALPANMVLLNEAGKIVAVNESWKKFTLANNLGVPRYGIGYSYVAISEKATGVDALSGKKIAKGINEVIAGLRDEFSMEYSYYSQNKKVWFQLIVAPLTDRTKKGAVILHIDITDRKLAEELLLQSKANLQTIFENTDIAYALCDAEHKIVSFNTKANELCLEQFNKKLKVGAYAFAYFPKSKIPNFKEAIPKITRNEMVSYETSYDLNDGSVKWYEVRWAGIANEQKENMGFILAFKDITERKVSDMERDRMTSDLVQRNRDLEQFTYIVSHNLRAPVANIMGLSNMLNGFDFDLNENREVKTALATSINVLDNMILDLNHILQVSNRVNERSEVVSFPKLVEDIVLSLRHLINNENAVVNYNFKAADKMIAIKSYMHSIFYNLILNGIKYKRPHVEPVISIFTRKNEGKLEILFRDNGKGIEEKNLKNMFGLYKRFDTSVEGKGMGLFMVKIQVESMEGKISAESVYGEGTRFKLEFPDVRGQL